VVSAYDLCTTEHRPLEAVNVPDLAAPAAQALGHVVRDPVFEKHGRGCGEVDPESGSVDRLLRIQAAIDAVREDLELGLRLLETADGS
jgi:hypothetical protein